MARIVVAGYMLRNPLIGNVLAYLQYVVGLHRLGHEVTYMEESGWPYACYDPVAREWFDHPTSGLRLVRGLLRHLTAPVPVYWINRETGAIDGGTRRDIERLLHATDLVLNIGGVSWLPEFQLCERRALIDLDPVFTQVEMFGAKILGDYQFHFSYGINIGRPQCAVPTAGVDWWPTVPPVIPEPWQSDAPSQGGPFTTIANWSAYGGLDVAGEHYGQKDEEFLSLIDLPRRTLQSLELALGGGHDVRQTLREHGWFIRDAEEVSLRFDDYRQYLAHSRGEFSVAKNAYVKTRCGWFSDRSVCYLASGRPCVLQDTGFSDWLPTGHGVVAFNTCEEAVEGIDGVNRDYARHSAAARQLVQEYFDYRVVLPHLLDACLGGDAPYRNVAEIER